MLAKKLITCTLPNELDARTSFLQTMSQRVIAEMRSKEPLYEKYDYVFCVPQVVELEPVDSSNTLCESHLGFVFAFTDPAKCLDYGDLYFENSPEAANKYHALSNLTYSSSDTIQVFAPAELHLTSPEGRVEPIKFFWKFTSRISLHARHKG